MEGEGSVVLRRRGGFFPRRSEKEGGNLRRTFVAQLEAVESELESGTGKVGVSSLSRSRTEGDDINSRSHRSERHTENLGLVGPRYLKVVEAAQRK